ncbi:MAG: FAD-containing monooxygenase EthA [Gammaproteobacteria bacterium]|nr:FAD-containing monooxygenase EthA [Gammaproteobacteria bacterium]
MESYDVVIVGAGISGVSAAVHLQKFCPKKTFKILEARESVGGTWDLFRYPGIRSDSDMHTLGFDFKPWKEAKSIADGPSILKYVNETVDEYGLRGAIQFGQRVKRAEWDSGYGLWSIETENPLHEKSQFSCSMLFMCGGYYDYESPHDAAFQNTEAFSGEIVHPQFWPQNLEYKGKKVVVIGSGATAMTLAPAMADSGAKVTMVQRSPTYVASRPDEDKFANFLRKVLPESWAYAITRFKNTRYQAYLYQKSRVSPGILKKILLDSVRNHLGKEMTDKHFTPSYNPWDQRLCLIPNADLFTVIKRGDLDLRTEGIDSFVEDGLKLISGEILPADIIVTATGLKLKVLSGVKFVVDEKEIDLARSYTYKGMMFSSIPNLIQTFGYINASWTLRADLTSEYACRLLNHMDKVGADFVTPTLSEEDMVPESRDWIEDFPSGYMKRSMHLFPRQGPGPWQNTQDFSRDKKMVRRSAITDRAMIFSNRTLSKNSA